MNDLELTQRIMAGHPELRVSDIPESGMILDEGYLLVCNQEGEVSILPLDPNAE